VHLIAPKGGVEFGTEVYLLIPAQTYASGMAFAIRATDGTQMIYSTKSSFNAQPGKIYPLNVSYSPEVSDITLMSSNVRFASARDKNDNPDTGDRDWTNRKSAYYKMLNTLQPDIVGLQEAEQEQVVDILNNCSGYSYVGYGRESGKDITSSFSSFEQFLGKDHGESTTILYKTDKFTKHSGSWFCHSKTPNTADTYFPGTTDEQPRISTWVILIHKDTGRKFFYLNTHTTTYDVREQEILLIKEQVEKLNTEKLPVILSADWNLVEDDSWMLPITENYLSARKTAPITDNCYTYHWWESTSDKKQIDHIYYKDLECFEFRTVNQKWDGLYISDHYPIYAKFNLAEFTIPVYTECVEGNAGHESYNPESLF
jgi:endonuclease/exonuclease/phosphatase family metal-dependent hydrolase